MRVKTGRSALPVLLLLLALILASRGGPPAVEAELLSESALHCGALPAPTGNVINVRPSQVNQLPTIVQNAASGDVILLADGLYELNGDYLWFDTPGVTLRSASGNRDAVILDGNYATTEIITVAASDVTIADVTIRRAMTHAIHVIGGTGGHTRNTLIYNVHIVDPGQQAIKINANDARYADYGEVACSHIELTDAGRPRIWQFNGSCYTGGVDGHQARGWTVRDNTIEGFWCERDLAEHAVHFWTGSRDTLVERNRIVNNSRGIGFGLLESGQARTYNDNPCPGAGHVDHYDGIIRNNMIFVNRGDLFTSEYGFDCGICAWAACGAEILHNTVVSTQAPFSSIEWRFSATDVTIVNNLVSHNLQDRGGTSFLAGNLTNAPLSLFVDGTNGDLHLAPDAGAAIDQVAPPASGCADDFDGDSRPVGADFDIGADEYRLSAPSLRSPGNGSTTRDTTPRFDWHDFPGSPTRYQLKVDNNRDFPSPEINVMPRCSAYITRSALGEGRYWWQVRVRDAAGNWSRWSNVWRVTIDTTPPSRPRLVSPGAGSNTSDATPRFDWRDSTGRPTLYHLQVDNNRNFSSPAINVKRRRSAYTAQSPLSPGTYYWWVRARDAAGNWSAWSRKFSFTITSGSAAGAINADVPIVGCFEEANPAWEIQGLWLPRFSQAASSGEFITYSSGRANPNVYLEFTFAGESFALVYHRSPFGGIADVFIDDMTTPYAQVDMYAANELWLDNAVLYVSGLDPTIAHVLRIAPSGTKNLRSQGYAIFVDRLDLPVYHANFEDECLFLRDEDERPQ